jgi:hypothetical protein
MRRTRPPSNTGSSAATVDFACNRKWFSAFSSDAGMSTKPESFLPDTTFNDTKTVPAADTTWTVCTPVPILFHNTTKRACDLPAVWIGTLLPSAFVCVNTFTNDVPMFVLVVETSHWATRLSRGVPP